MRNMARYGSITFIIYLLVTGCIAVFLQGSAEASVALPWSTTYGSCADWLKYTDTLSCDGLQPAGANMVSPESYSEQITAAANNPSGGGGKGQRHWIGDGKDNITGGTYLYFSSSQREIWMRWYMRYQAGFHWSTLGYQKILYFDPQTAGGALLVIEFYGADQMRIWSYAAGAGFVSPSGTGWTHIHNGADSDGTWHAYEIHIKVDTNGTDGAAEMWVDGNKIINSQGVSLGQKLLNYVRIGSNAYLPSNGQSMYCDFDDLAITATGYIGPLGTGGSAPLAKPSPPSSLR